MNSIVIDCAVSGPWNFRAAPTDPEQGHCVRVSYLALNGQNMPYEWGSLIVSPPEQWGWEAPSKKNEELGGITLGGLIMEGSPIEQAPKHAMWRRIMASQRIICHATAFHLAALVRLADDCGWDNIDALMLGREPYCTMIKSVDQVGIPDPRDIRRNKQPKLSEAFDHFMPGRFLDMERIAAMDGPRPVHSFGMTQVRAVWSVYCAREKIELDRDPYFDISLD